LTEKVQEAPLAMTNAPHVFHRNVTSSYPLAVQGEGAIVIDAEGRRFIDGTAGVFVAILGHSPAEVAEKISEQARRLNFAYTGNFTTEAEQRLSDALADLAPPGLSRVWLTTSGSTANEAALKLARNYHLLRGHSEKTRVIARWHSYHGSTIGALSMTGTPPRRRPYEPYLLDFPHVCPPYCYRCPVGLDPSTCDTECANEVEAVINKVGAQYISAVILEPIAGGPLGALVTPPDYLRRVRDICDRHDVLLIVDEVVSGLGRSGSWFAIEESGVVPDMITLAKGLGGGFVPVGALVVHERIYETFQERASSFVHGESFTGHVLLAAAGLAVIDYIKDHDLLARIRRLAPRLRDGLHALSASPIVGEVRGMGFIYGLELVRDKVTKDPFERTLQVSERVVGAAARRGTLLLAGNAAADGVNGDTIVIAPPYVITEEQIDTLIDALAKALTEVADEIGTESEHPVGA
jgi:adenosylmethionine-8-amino-7-oxononanoate aminotransferase